MSTLTLPMAKLEIDHPQQDQTVTSAIYTFRVDGPETLALLEISVDRGPWQACRRACGYWWYDWSGYADGEHDVIARIRGRNGRWRMSAPRRLLVATTV